MTKADDPDQVLEAFDRRTTVRANLRRLDPVPDELLAMNKRRIEKATKELKKTGINEDDEADKPPFKPSSF